MERKNEVDMKYVTYDKLYEIAIGMYKQAAIDIEALLAGYKVDGDDIYSILDWIADGPLEIRPIAFLRRCIETRMEMSKIKKMPPEWRQYIEYAEYIQDMKSEDLISKARIEGRMRRCKPIKKEGGKNEN